MSIRYLIEQISKTQDGNPLHRYVDTIFDGIQWKEFSPVEDMSVSEVLDLLLVKIASSEEPEDSLAYVIDQLQRSKAAIQ